MKMYVLLRSDLHPTYASVQAGHALADFILMGNNGNIAEHWGNGTLIYLNGGTLRSMTDTLERLSKIPNLPIQAFREPDLQDQLTAIAVYCDGYIFKDFKTF